MQENRIKEFIRNYTDLITGFLTTVLFVFMPVAVVFSKLSGPKNKEFEAKGIAVYCLLALGIMGVMYALNHNNIGAIKKRLASPMGKIASVIMFITGVVIPIWTMFSHLSKPYARVWDKDWGFYYLLVTAIVTVVGFIVSFKDLKAAIVERSPSIKGWIIAIIITAFFGGFVYTQIERQHRVLSDESSWESMALQMFHSGRSGTCNQGYWVDADAYDAKTGEGANYTSYDKGKLICTDEVNNFKGKTSGFLNYISYFFGGSPRDAALRVNYTLYLLSILLLFYGIFLAVKNETIALMSILYFASIPTMMFQSQTATTEVAYVFFLALIMVVAQLFNNRGMNWKHFLIIVPLMGFFAQTRQETVFSFLPFALFFYAYFRKDVWRMPLFTVAVIIACWPVINTIAGYRGYDFQGGDYDAHSAWNLVTNFFTNIKILLNLNAGKVFPDFSSEPLLLYPFNTTTTILLYMGVIYLTFHVIFKPKYRWGYLLCFLSMIQAIVIMINVSGNFTIDINQRYVLVAFPVFALIFGLFIGDIIQRLSSEKNLNQNMNLGLFLVAFLTVGLTLYHKNSFNANIHYYRNKLLKEEKVLHQILNLQDLADSTKFSEIARGNTDYPVRTYPKGSLFIYARPWQMLCSGLNSFSESKFLNWNTDTFAEWVAKTNNNIYLVRGQDGFGKVNRKSRVVGFKTTTKVDKIMSDYSVTQVYSNGKDFGYPLSVYKIESPKNVSEYATKISVSNNKVIHTNEDPVVFNIAKRMDKSIPYQLFIGKGNINNENSALNSELKEEDREAKVDLSQFTLEAGINPVQLKFMMPDNEALLINKSIFNKIGSATLMSDLKTTDKRQDWGSAQFNKSVEKNALQVNGNTYAFGMGTHANSEVTFQLDGKYNTFHAEFGMDDESLCGDGAQFKVYGDDRVLYTSKSIHAHQMGQAKVPVTNVNKLILMTDSLSNNFCDHTDWINLWVE